MEHMVLSYNSKSAFRMSRNFEDWLGDNDGAANGFTAYRDVCFHFSCPESALLEALQRFAGLFLQEDVEIICRDADALKREVRRVDSELDFGSVASQATYLTKDFVNLEHPYARFSAGSLESLEIYPSETGIDVSESLIEFFRKKYLPEEAVLVIVGRQDLFALERMASPFSTTLSRARTRKVGTLGSHHYPGAFLEGSRNKQLVLFSNEDTADVERNLLELESRPRLPRKIPVCDGYTSRIRLGSYVWKERTGEPVFVLAAPGMGACQWSASHLGASRRFRFPDYQANIVSYA